MQTQTMDKETQGAILFFVSLSHPYVTRFLMCALGMLIGTSPRPDSMAQFLAVVIQRSPDLFLEACTSLLQHESADVRRLATSFIVQVTPYIALLKDGPDMPPRATNEVGH